MGHGIGSIKRASVEVESGSGERNRSLVGCVDASDGTERVLPTGDARSFAPRIAA